MATASATLRLLLDRLDDLSDEAGHDTLAVLRDRLESARLRVLVAGEAKRGKSTLVNALLGREVLPSGVVPLTAVAATVVQAPAGDEGIEVAFTTGGTRRFPLSALADYGTERGNPGNRRQVASITVGVNAPVLARGVEIVDTPGTGSVHAHNTAAADEALPSMDAAVFVLSADPPVSASERDLLRRVADLSVALFVVLNKADYLDEVSLTEAVEFTAAVVAGVTGGPQRVYPLSARNALSEAVDAGFAAFAADFTGYLDSGRMAGLDLSVSRHAQRLAQQLLDEVLLAQRAARLPGEQAAAQIAAFGARLDAVTSRQVDAKDRATAQSGRLLSALNDAAAAAVPRLSAAIATDLTAQLDADLAEAPPADIQREGRARLTRLVASAVEAWRQEQASRLEAGLGEIDDKLAAELEAELAAVRAAAADLLGLELALPSPGEKLTPSLGFFYTMDERVDQAELLAGSVRRRLPGEYGRRVARQRLLSEVPDLVASQLGRARGDLQYRLAEATRRLQRDVHRRYAGTTQRLSAALDRAAGIRADAEGHGRDQLAGLSQRERLLRGLLDELAGVGTTAGASAPLSNGCYGSGQ